MHQNFEINRCDDSIFELNFDENQQQHVIWVADIFDAYVCVNDNVENYVYVATNSGSAEL